MKIKEKKVIRARKAIILDAMIELYRQKEWFRETRIEVSRLVVKRYIRAWAKEALPQKLARDKYAKFRYLLGAYTDEEYERMAFQKWKEYLPDEPGFNQLEVAPGMHAAAVMN